MTIRVVLADDQALLRAGFRVLIDAATDLEVVGEAADGDEAVAVVRETRPDVVLMDIRMPGTDGLAATEAIVADPGLSGVRIIVLTTFELDEYVVAAIRAGASGFLGKGVDPVDLLDAIRVVAGGEALLSPAATKVLIGRFVEPESAAGAPTPPSPAAAAALDVLTPREREVVALVGSGLTNDEIAESLFVSPLTAKTHVNRAMMKLGARDRAQLVVVAYESGLVRPSGT
jgi:DNA-binding NarL/FixJ family response regulator